MHMCPNDILVANLREEQPSANLRPFLIALPNVATKSKRQNVSRESWALHSSDILSRV